MASTSAPVVIYPGQPVQNLKRLPRVHKEFDENFLQELLATHPDLLPITDIRSDAGALLCIGREVPVPSGSIDNLYLSTAGYPVVVETKLWRNPEARREALSQTLDYIKDLVQKDYVWLEDQWKLHQKAAKQESTDLIDRIGELAQEDIDETSYIDRVNGALERGDVLAMIVGDGIETRLQDLVAHLCRDSAHLRYGLALCELSFYQLSDKKDDGMVVIPRIVHNVEPVQRAYVRVDLANGLEEKLIVTPVIDIKPPRPRGTRINLSEEEFLDVVAKRTNRETAQQIKETYDDLCESFELEPVFKASAVMLKIPDPLCESSGVSVIAFNRRGTIYNTSYMRKQLGRWPQINRPKAAEITMHYWEALNAVDGKFDKNGISPLKWNHFIQFADIYPKMPKIKDCIGKVVAEIKAASEADEK